MPSTFNLMLKLLAAFFIFSIFISVGLTYAKFGSPAVALVYLNQLPINMEERVTNPNFSPSLRELACEKQHPHPPARGRIPKTVHYVLLSNEGSNSTLTFPAYLSIKATIKNIQPETIKLHYYDIDTEGEWFRRIAHRIEPVRHARNRRLGPNGRGIGDYLLAHQSDILRLDITQREGGIYLDTDVFAFRSFDNLLNSPQDVVLGHEGANRYGLCNAVIIARARSQFLQIWIDSYETFDDSSWNFHSVRLPKVLATEHPEHICTLSPMAFFWPTWAGRHTDMMYQPISDEEAIEVAQSMEKFNGSLYEGQFAYHAWGGAAWTKYLSKLTPERLIEENTKFNVLMRPIYNKED